jgi:integrase
MNLLSAKKVANLIKAGTPGRHFDGDGLYLQINGPTSASWMRRYQIPGAAPRQTRTGKESRPERYVGLGSARIFTLKEARKRNLELSKQLADKIDPLAQRRAKRLQDVADAAKAKSFGQVAQNYFDAHSASWRSPKHRVQWLSSVLGVTPTGKPVKVDYCRALRPMPVQKVDTPVVMSVLQPVSRDKPETASRLRARIAAVLDAAKAAGYRTGDNPAAAEIVSHLLPVRSKTRKIKHFPAVPFPEMPGFMAELRERDGSAARALEFLILTAARTNEVLQATWSEINFADKSWAVAPERMKVGIEHRVPLTPEVIELLGPLPRMDGHPFVFLSSQVGRPLSKESLLRLMRRMMRTESVHGFRSSFSDWAHETTRIAPHLIEACLAHVTGTKSAQAYRRGDLFEKRRRLMEQWASYCHAPAVEPADDNVVSIGAAR